MPGGIYTALSGLQTHAGHLDRLASDIANAGTSGYKGQRAASAVAARPTFDAALDSAVDVVSAAPQADFRPGEMAPTGRDLDLAIEGPGFFSVQTPTGVKYTRDGHFTRRADGTLTAQDDSPVLGADGPIQLPQGTLDISDDGTFRVGQTTIGRPLVTVFDDPTALIREDGVRFRAPGGVVGTDSTTSPVRSGMLEQSNVQLNEGMAQLAELSRGYEALTRGVSVLMNDIDGRAITELGRR